MTYLVYDTCGVKDVRACPRTISISQLGNPDDWMSFLQKHSFTVPEALRKQNFIKIQRQSNHQN